jgi:hypothetical protein
VIIASTPNEQTIQLFTFLSLRSRTDDLVRNTIRVNYDTSSVAVVTGLMLPTAVDVNVYNVCLFSFLLMCLINIDIHAVGNIKPVTTRLMMCHTSR